LPEFAPVEVGGLRYCAELRKLRQQLTVNRPQGLSEKIVFLSYQPGTEEPGPEKSFELSATALAQRWNASFLDMQHSEGACANADITYVQRPRN
jgi:hypothetical protein